MSHSITPIADDVRLDLGHTIKTGALSLRDDRLVLVTPTGTAEVLAKSVFVGIDGDTIAARQGAVLIEEFGLSQKLPAALVASGHLREVSRHSAISPWGVDVVELEPTHPFRAPSAADTESE